MNISRSKLVGLGHAILAGVLWLYWPGVNGEFLSWDDHDNLQQAERRNGLRWNAVKWLFTDTLPCYQPLPRLSHKLR
jgi:hypothetical protein